MATKKLKIKLKSSGAVATQAKDGLPRLVVAVPVNDAPTGDVELTEDAIAEDFAVRYGDDLRFDHSIGRWYIWDGVRWKINRTELAFDFARRLCREHRGDKRMMASKKAAEGVEHMARKDRRLAVTSEKWDRDTFLLGTPGGTVDLRTGELKAAVREDYITKLVAVTPAKKGTPCPIFEKFLDDATCGDEAVKRLLLQWGGYSLTGDTSEHGLLFIYGTGGNGKGVLRTVFQKFWATTPRPQVWRRSSR